jgi:hypothetical protein
MQPIPVVFILGSGHCGATLLDMLLDSHSQMCGIGELHAGRASSICTCGKPAPECVIWQHALGPLPWNEQGIFKSKLNYLFDRGIYRCAKGAPTPIDEADFISINMKMFHALLSDRQKSIIVDSSKEVERAELLSRSPEIRPVIIHLVRDGRGATWTYINKYKKLMPYFYMWTFSNLKIEILRRRFNKRSNGQGKFIYLRFADLINDTEKTLRWLCDEIGVPYEPQMLVFDEQEHHQIEGNGTRFVPGHIIYPDKKWQEMPRGLRAVWTLSFGILNLYYKRIKKSSVVSE